jgi:hypothetical protein
MPSSEAEAFREYGAIKGVKRDANFDELPPRAKLLRYSKKINFFSNKLLQSSV